MNPHGTNPPSSDRSEYSLSVEQASEAFNRAGAPRSPRTITRYCAQGHLDCVKTETQQNEKYLITRESINRRIEEINQITATSRVETRPDTSSHDQTSRDKSEGSTRPDDFLRKVESLEAQVQDLKITNRAKDYFLDQLKAERASFLDKTIRQSRRIGELETRLQLGPATATDSPDALPPRPDETHLAGRDSSPKAPDSESPRTLDDIDRARN